MLEELVIALCVYAADVPMTALCIADPPPGAAEAVLIRESPVTGCDVVAREKALAALDAYLAVHPDVIVRLAGTTCRVLR